MLVLIDIIEAAKTSLLNKYLLNHSLASALLKTFSETHYK